MSSNGKTPKSSWRKYFITKKDNTTAICKYCSKELKTCSNTTNLKQHMERKHLNVLQANHVAQIIIFYDYYGPVHGSYIYKRIIRKLCRILNENNKGDQYLFIVFSCCDSDRFDVSFSVAGNRKKFHDNYNFYSCEINC